MSRFVEGDIIDLDSLLAFGRWKGRRKSVLNGKPGLASLKELEQVLLSMKRKRLIEGELCDGTDVCVNGAWLYRTFVNQGISPKEAWKKLQYQKEEPHTYEELDRTTAMSVKEIGITKTLSEIIAWDNDDFYSQSRTPEDRYSYVLQRVQQYIRNSKANQQSLNA